MLSAEMLAHAHPELSLRRPALVAVLAAAASILLAGCDSPQQAQQPILHPWDGYMPTLAVSLQPAASSDYHAEYARRDIALATRGDVINTPSMYPPEPRPSLEFPRRYYFPTSSNGYTYFRSEQEVRSTSRWRWGY